MITMDKIQENKGDRVSYKPSKKDKSCADRPPTSAVPFDFGAAAGEGRMVVGIEEKGTRGGDMVRDGTLDPLLGVSKRISREAGVEPCDF